MISNDQPLFLIILGTVLVVIPPLSAEYDCSSDRCYRYSRSVIDCQDLELTTVPQFCPQVTLNLTYDSVDLSENRLKRIGASAFRNIQVEGVVIRKNDKKVNITFHPKAFRGLENFLKKIEFEENKIPELPTGLFRNLYKLETIDLKNNKIRSMQIGMFRGAKNVQKINLENNLLQVLDDHVFGGLIKLKELKLTRNNISMVHSNAFSSLKELDKLDLSRNKIRDLQPKTFYSLDKLNKLDLSHNSIAALFPLMFRGLQKLEEITLSHNPIILIAKETFSTMVSLKRLELQKCKLTYLKPGVFDGLKNLRFLQLHHNLIRSLPNGLFSNLKFLRRLHLDFNELTTLNACAFDDVSDVEEILMTGNPVHCDCLMAWSSRTDTAKIIGKCQSPLTSKGENITQPTKYNVCVQTEYGVNCKQQGMYSYVSNDVMKYRNYIRYMN